MTRLKRLALTIGGVAAVSGGAAQAAWASYAYTPGGTPPVFNGPSPNDYYGYVVPNYTYVRMVCWTDTVWYSVNYWSPRWFKVSTPYTSTTWMHSSEVYSQTTVPHC